MDIDDGLQNQLGERADSKRHNTSLINNKRYVLLYV